MADTYIPVGFLPTVAYCSILLGTMSQPLTSKPMARAKRVSLFHKEIRTTLSSAAIEILFGQAQLLSEGQMDGSSYFGSSMITIDLRQASEWVSDPCDATTMRQIGDLLLQDDRFRSKARQMGEQEATRLAQKTLGPMQIEMHMHNTTTTIHIDIDVEAPSLQARAS